jgi:hypothetical protein
MSLTEQALEAFVRQRRLNRLHAEAMQLTDKLYDAWVLAMDENGEAERLNRLVARASRRTKRRLLAKLPPRAFHQKPLQ